MSNPPSARKFEAVRKRQLLYQAIRGHFVDEGFDEVEVPLLVPAPAMEPHIEPFACRFVPEMGASGPERTLYLHSSPEYAMKRLLADGWEKIFFLGKVFRNGEIAKTHNPEFSMLEFYRAGRAMAGAGSRGFEPILADIESFTRRAARAICGSETIAWRGREIDLSGPWERLTVAEAFARVGIDLPLDGDAQELRRRAAAAGFELPSSLEAFDDLFFAVFLSIEPDLGFGRPTFLVDWPASMASLSRISPEDPRVAQRFELYIGGMELANGFHELNDEAEQRRRLEAERKLRAELGRPVHPIDERFLAAVGRMPDAAGVAVGIDRLLMLLGGFASIDETLLFPATEEYR